MMHVSLIPHRTITTGANSILDIDCSVVLILPNLHELLDRFELILLIVSTSCMHEHQGSVLGWVTGWMNEHHLNFLPFVGLARGCLTLVAV